jgi:hypothetical protein
MKNLNILILSFILLSTSNLVFSQDIIYLKNGDKVLTIIEEITPDMVKYKKYDNQSGPIYSVFKSDVLVIDYENGKTEVFESQGISRKSKSNGNGGIKISNEDFGRHFAGVNLAGFVGTNIHLLYEYTFKNNVIGIRLPLMFRLGSGESDVFEYTNNFLTGIDFRFYPTGQGIIKYVFTPSIAMGNVRYTAFQWIDNPNDPWGGGIGIEERRTDFQNIFQIYNGIVFTPVPNLRFGMDIGFGVRNVYNKQLGSETNPYASFMTYLGYKF